MLPSVALTYNLKVVGSNPTPATNILVQYQTLSALRGAFCVLEFLVVEALWKQKAAKFCVAWNLVLAAETAATKLWTSDPSLFLAQLALSAEAV